MSGDIFSQADRERVKKDVGMSLAVTSGQARRHLNFLRGVAQTIARSRPDWSCSSDDVRLWCEQNDYEIVPGNWLGSLSKDGNWLPTDRRVKSKHAQSHAREVRVWLLKLMPGEGNAAQAREVG